MSRRRGCAHSTCGRSALATLTYNYGDQIAVLGPLSTYAEPHAYDLCRSHAERLSAPRGWQVVKLALEPSAPGPSADDLVALADAVREAAMPPADEQPTGHGTEVGRRGHLRVLRSGDTGPS